jgi:hypothetical protein
MNSNAGKNAKYHDRIETMGFVSSRLLSMPL